VQALGRTREMSFLRYGDKRTKKVKVHCVKPFEEPNFALILASLKNMMTLAEKSDLPCRCPSPILPDGSAEQVGNEQ
jgi:hypothetical protein